MKRRELLLAAAAAPLTAVARPAAIRRVIPATGESIPAVGMGTWLTFDVGSGVFERSRRREVLAEFAAAGGGMIDSSPMYGRSEEVVGQLLPQVRLTGRLFSATKVWSAFDRVGVAQLEQSLKLWGLPRLDLVQVHNLLNWRGHLPMLRRAKEAGKIRTIGVTTSHGRAFDEMASLLKSEPVDFMQVSYSLADTSAAPLLELAARRGVAVIVNRPFDGGQQFDRIREPAPPDWARAAGCSNWPEFFLKWVIAHPAVTCAIPATTNPQHMAQNMAAATGPLPDAALRERMWQHWLTLR